MSNYKRHNMEFWDVLKWSFETFQKILPSQFDAAAFSKVNIWENMNFWEFWEISGSGQKMLRAFHDASRVEMNDKSTCFTYRCANN